MSMMLLMRVFHSVPELDYSAWFREDEDQVRTRTRSEEWTFVCGREITVRGILGKYVRYMYIL